MGVHWTEAAPGVLRCWKEGEGESWTDLSAQLPDSRSDPQAVRGENVAVAEGEKRVRNWFISLRLLYTERTVWASYPRVVLGC